VIVIRLVLGLGNLLLGDEGIGLHVIQQLSRMSLPPDVQILDGGTLGPALLGYLDGVDHLYIVDAMAGDGPPGSCYIVSDEDVNWVERPVISMHQLGVLETVTFARKSGFGKPITIVGIEPECIEYSTNLSGTLKTLLASIVGEVNRLLADTEVLARVDET